jgi:hypothetical protein
MSVMLDPHRALADLETIRVQLARQTRFLGFGPATLAMTAALALVTGFVQGIWQSDDITPLAFFGLWIAIAIVSVAIVGAEVVRRSRRFHRGLSDAMLIQAVEMFLPVGLAGACLGLVFARCAVDQVWMLPGLWQMLVGLGLFAAGRSLPWQAGFVGGWYLVSGCAGFVLASETHILSPALMAVPFAVGQAAMAVVMARFGGARDV